MGKHELWGAAAGLMWAWVGAMAAVPAAPSPEDPGGFSPQRLLGEVRLMAEVWQPESPVGGNAPEWQAFHYDAGPVALALGSPVELGASGLTDQDLAGAAERFVQHHAVDLGVDGCETEAQVVYRSANTTVISVKVAVRGLPVYGANIVLSLDRRGRLASLKATGFGSELEGDFTLAENQAAAIAEAAAGLAPGEGGEEVVRKVAYPVLHRERTLRPAFEVSLFPPAAHRRPVVFIDGATGEVLGYENRVVYERLSGVVDGWYHPRREDDEEVQAAFSDELFSLAGVGNAYSDGGGRFSYEIPANRLPANLSTELRGRWVNVDYEDGDDARQVVRVGEFTPVTLHWSDDNSRADERSLFVHVNRIHAYWKALDPGFNALDYPLRAVCQYGEAFENAFWNGQGIFFGGGGDNMGNFALFAGIIYHEYGHAVTSPGIYDWGLLPYEDESGALNEAWSDYFPCSLMETPLMGEGIFNGFGYIRNLDNNLVYPRDLQGEVHQDSRIISAAMWHTREVLGADYCDSLFHFARYHLGTDFLSYFADVLLTDDEDGDITNGTPHDWVLYQQFGRHGIGPGVEPRLSIAEVEVWDDRRRGADGDSDRYWEPGETIRLEVTVRREGLLYPPPAEGLSAVVQTVSPHLRLVRGRVQYPPLRVGDRTRAAEPLLVRVSAAAPTAFADLVVTVLDADMREYARDTVSLPLGRPELLLVRDGTEGADYTAMFAEDLRASGVVFAASVTANPILPLDRVMNDFRAVIWFTGDARTGTLTPSSRSTLGRFIGQGGHVLITGQSLDLVEGADEFWADYFGARHAVDSVRAVYAEGVAGDPVGDGLRLLTLGWRGARNQTRPSALEAVGNGVECFRWAHLEGQPAAGVRRENDQSGAKTVYLGFGLEGVGGHGDTDSRRAVLSAVLNWFGVGTEASPLSSVPVTFLAEPAFPNPFNSAVQFPFTLPAGGVVTMSFYDLQGRLAANQQRFLPAGANVWRWEAKDLPAGTYLVELCAGGARALYRVTLAK